MVRVGTPSDGSKPAGPYAAYQGPPSEFNTNLRKISAVALAVLLYSAAIPFNPAGWFFAVEGAFFVDALCSGIILLCACYFQWRIAGLTHALAISVPSPGGSTIRGGRIERGGSSTIFIWQSSNYWPYAVCEAVLLSLAEFGHSELLRRSIVIGVVSALWVLGWHATPRAYKTWAWEHIKSMWFWMILSELLKVGRPTVGRRARRF
ncbi:hypothetical protein BKA67DRAFT_555847 [Truncatella angustata]|uniref:Uncharacterized protein n=1 Tax=Truncatella angustata TaxID=152316 RepID=A0A9P8ZZU4_9PEZI|nr:uncharacterized protein BKA67DRAFT_555847 [Truncatella angustata]KAH6657632.1 hypothetical protein BKA67DRAFT_555847 [Truncatella angustata]KAH8204555.1 hypothetical protein TruAng_001329 [Truncatella angustata]